MKKAREERQEVAFYMFLGGWPKHLRHPIHGAGSNDQSELQNEWAITRVSTKVWWCHSGISRMLRGGQRVPP